MASLFRGRHDIMGWFVSNSGTVITTNVPIDIATGGSGLLQVAGGTWRARDIPIGESPGSSGP